MMDDDDVVENPPIVWNWTRGFDGHYSLKELEAVQTVKGQWWVTCKPILPEKDFSFWRSLFGGGKKNSKVYKALIEDGCRFECPGGKNHRKAVIYFDMNPDEMPEWLASMDLGMVKQIVLDIKNEGLKVRELVRQYDLDEEQLRRAIASSGADDRYAKKWKSQISDMIQILALAKKAEDDKSVGHIPTPTKKKT